MKERKQKHRPVNTAIMVMLLIASCGWAELHLEFPGPEPGLAQGRISRSELILENKVLTCAWEIHDGQFKPKRVTDKLSATTLQLRKAECFQLILDDERTVEASDMKIVAKPKLKNLEPKSKSFPLARQFSGKQITVILASSDNNLKVEWRAILRDGSNYIRQQVAFSIYFSLMKTRSQRVECNRAVPLGSLAAFLAASN
jgi:hypothetical protein